jgi:DinB family protein
MARGQVSRPSAPMIQRTLLTLLRELAEGPAPEAAWVLNPGDRGLLRSLDKLSAASASAKAAGSDSSIAAHVDHLRYGLHLMNRWSKGESPFADADYAASWRSVSVDEEEWRVLRDRLRAEIEQWGAAIQQPRDLAESDLTGIVASVVHLAYHLGAIRQMDRSIRGPKADD